MSTDLQGKVIVITGGSSGIGAAAARELRRRGATVAITGRSAETTRLAQEIGAEAFLVDFKKLNDVRRLAEELKARYPRIDVLVNNVGGIMGARHLTEDGHEATFQVNHLSGFLLTALLFWWALLRGRDRERAYGSAVFYLFLTAAHSGFLGVLIALARRSIYPLQSEAAMQWGLTPFEDQQLAGLIMWVPFGLVYAIAALSLAGIWIARGGMRHVPSA